MTEAVVFDAAGHRYFVGKREYPSVTTVLSAIFPFPLDREAARFYLMRGTAVHLATQLDDEGDLDEARLDPMLRPYLAAWRGFRNYSGFKIDADGIETRRHHATLGYAGTIDRVGVLKDGRRFVIDIKTGGKYAQYRVQLAAYVAMMDRPGDYMRASVSLAPDGTFAFNECPRDEYLADFAVFQSALNIYRFKVKHKLL